jgi:hypothetical protein
VDRAALGAHEQDAVGLERDEVLEELAPRRRGRELGRLGAGLDLGDEPLAAGLDEVVGADLGLLGRRFARRSARAGEPLTSPSDACDRLRRPASCSISWWNSGTMVSAGTNWRIISPEKPTRKIHCLSAGGNSSST